MSDYFSIQKSESPKTCYIDIKIKLSRGEIWVAKFKAPCEWCEFGQVFRHPRVLSIRVGEIFLCLISINSRTRFADRGIFLQTGPLQKNNYDNFRVSAFSFGFGN